MPRSRPATTGYERLAQADQFSDDSDDDPLAQSYASLQHPAAPRYAPISQPRPHSGMTSPKFSGARGGRRGRRARSNSGVDLKAINARLEKWADEIASKFKRRSKKTGEEDERLEIHHSVFQAPEGVRPVTAEILARPEPGYMTKAEFETIVNSVRTAIDQGVHPRMISQGSSGSYFARNLDGKVVGVFKPKDEEPLIPNLSYVSEAAAYVLDAQLRTHMVPYTDVVNLSSKSFHYPFWDRYNHSRKKKALPAKPGSFQVFLTGFKDANIFLREHPWPDQYLSGFRTNDPQRKKKKRWADSCRPSNGQADDVESDDGEDSPQSLTPGPDNFVWTPTLKQSFREELEKLVILDYIMRNTDRGLDNWMIKVDWESQQASIVSEPVRLNTEGTQDDELGPRPVDVPQRDEQPTRAAYPYRAQKPMDASTPLGSSLDPKITVGAIDNSLSWPWKHPDAWRSFPFGWLFLPVDLIGRPFSPKTREHFLPLLTSTAWWSQTQLALRRVFQIDPDFQERMFARQIAVMKGQAWNVVETLKTPDHGPLELTRRAKVCVWDDLVDVPIAVPMRVTSSEMRRRTAAESSSSDMFFSATAEADEEEMDIGAANSSSAPVDLLGLSVGPSPPADLPHPGRFEISVSATPSIAEEPASAPDGTPAQPLNGTAVVSASVPSSTSQSHLHARPPLPRTSLSHGPPRSLNMYSPERQREHQRRFSFATAVGRRNSNSIAAHLHGIGRHSQDGHYYGFMGDDDELEGDLGYAAAEGMEGNRRKVIVERLEPVKTRNPVFTCW
ncbi:hypothetical protein OQA88_11919 [Cercophora sp. LCS_1]